MYRQRKKMLRQIEEKRSSKALLYVTGDRPGFAAQIHPEVVDMFVDHLDRICDKRSVGKISLILYTRGGQTIAAWSLVNLLRRFSKEFEVIVPYKAHSAGTIVCLGADRIVMTKQAQLSPIDPSHNGPLNPAIPSQPNGTLPVSVEAINGFFDLARSDLNIQDTSDLTTVLTSLAEKVHPLVLGETYRARNQIKMLAKKLLSQRTHPPESIDKIISFLTAESGSHDYTIDREEAATDLALPIEKPDDELYELLRELYRDFSNEMQLREPYNPQSMFGTSNEVTYSQKTAIIESNENGSHAFVKEGILRRISGQDQNGVPQVLLNDQQLFQGWKHEPNSPE